MSAPTFAIVRLTPPKVGQVFDTQKSRTSALCLRVDTKPNGNLSIQYISLENLRRFINGTDSNYEPPTEWTTWYQQPKYDGPKFKGCIQDWSMHEHIINDERECECGECGEYHSVEGLAETLEDYEDRFNGNHYQVRVVYGKFTSVWQCPNCHNMNFTEKVEEDDE